MARPKKVTPRRRKPIIVEESGIAVRLFQRGAKWWADVRLDGERERVPLKTTVKTTAEDNARALAKETARQRLIGVVPDKVTLSQVFAAYRRHRVPGLTPARKREAETRMTMFTEAWGAVACADIDKTRVDTYCRKRHSLAVVPAVFRPTEDGRRRRGYRTPKPVRDGALASELGWLATLFNWATGFRLEGRRLLTENPLRGLSWPRERNPRRPVASHERFLRTMQHADAVDPAGRLRCIVALARYTGRRESAICGLYASDLLLSPQRIHAALAAEGMDEALADHMPFGAVRWRSDTDKCGFLFISPISEAARAEIDHYVARNPRLGDTPLFPAPGRKRKKDAPQPKEPAPEKSLRRDTALRWLMRAEQRAELPKLVGGAFHPYRRLWATERKHLPDADVAAAGGWRGMLALRRSYQQADPATVFRVVSGA